MVSAQGSSSRAPVSDFSSPEYWSQRFTTEKSFEWLASSQGVEAVILDVVKEVVNARRSALVRPTHRLVGSCGSGESLNILHFGCGTSSLGRDVSAQLRAEGLEARVVDADYVAELIPGRTETSLASSTNNASIGSTTPCGVPLISLDVLDPKQLAATAPEGGWDILLDKSMADAISCGPEIARKPRTGQSDASEQSDTNLVEPIRVLCDNLAAVTRPGGRWICISYSSTRFDHLKSTSIPNSDVNPLGSTSDAGGWRLIRSIPITDAYPGILPAQPANGDQQGSDGGTGTAPRGSGTPPRTSSIVYAPDTHTWAYVLERL